MSWVIELPTAGVIILLIMLGICNAAERLVPLWLAVKCNRPCAARFEMCCTKRQDVRMLEGSGEEGFFAK